MKPDNDEKPATDANSYTILFWLCKYFHILDFEHILVLGQYLETKPRYLITYSNFNSTRRSHQENSLYINMLPLK